MYLLDLLYDNAHLNGTGRISFGSGADTIRKWTVLRTNPESLELIRLLALACVGRKHVEHLAFSAEKLTGDNGRELRLEGIVVQHAPRDCSRRTRRILASALSLPLSEPQPKAVRLLPRPHGLRVGSLGTGSGVRAHLAVGHGSRLIAHHGTDCFDFTVPAPRARRLQSLFGDQARITDPVVFLARLHYRARRGRRPAQRILALLIDVFGRIPGMQTNTWLSEPSHDELPGDGTGHRQAEWDALDTWQQALLLPVLDAARHIIDASPHELDPLSRRGVMLIDAPDTYCSGARFAAWLGMLDKLFPALQFVITLSDAASAVFPEALRHKTLPAHDEWAKQSSMPSASRPRLSPGTTLLVDVDGRMPNLALMKLSSHLAGEGRARELVRGADWRREGAERVLASCVFDFEASHKRVAQMHEYYGDKLSLGGSGVDLSLRLPADVEDGVADYDLYPELGDRALGFLTRGCSRQCHFCIVPRKEGRPRQVAAIDDLLQGSRQKLILLDDNLLAHPHADRLLEEMAQRHLAVNFNQTLDIRLIDPHRARLLKRIRCSNVRFTRCAYHFSLNHTRELDLVRRKYELFQFSAKDNVEFVCMYGYDTTLAEDVERFAFLRSLPRAYVFVQKYRPVLGREQPCLADFFDDRADELIDRLVRIEFTQNMKSMEVYYRWLSAKYFETFGKLHHVLIDTLFRYNQRDRKGAYIARMLASRHATRVS